MRVLWAVALVGCRIGFDARPGDGGPPDGISPGSCNGITRFADDFEDGGDLFDMWTNSYAQGTTTYAETGGEVVLTLAANSPGTFVGYTTTRGYDLRGHRATVEVSQLTTGGAQTGFGVGSDTDNYVHYTVESGQLRIAQNVLGVFKTLNTIPYDATQRFWAIEERAGQLYFERSSDGVTFTTFFQAPAPIDVSLVTSSLFAGTVNAVASPGQARFASYNGGVATADPACPITTLVDPFDTALDALWRRSYTQACCTQGLVAGVLEMKTDGSLGFVAHRSTAGFDLREGTIAVSIPNAPAAGSTFYAVFGAHYDGNTGLDILLYTDHIVARRMVSGTTMTKMIPRNGEHFLRLRETGGMAYAEASVDKMTWTTIDQQPDQFRLDDAWITLEGGVANTATIADTITWDDLGVP